MKKLPLISIIIGTRPEAIKLAPVIIAFRESKEFDCRVILTGQHREMAWQVIKLFGINIDNNLDIMKPLQDLGHITSATINGLREEFSNFRPSLVLVQGDTTTAFAGALSAFYEKIPVGHVEAGLRTNKLNDPFPEEVNRRLISQLATIHFAPTEKSKRNLEASNVIGDIHMTGNTVIDALLLVKENTSKLDIKGLDLTKQKVILATIHRRENWGKKVENIAEGLKQILDNFPECSILLPLHKNQRVREPIKKILNNHPRAILTEPLDYCDLVSAIQACTLLLTDSGGLQEEAPALGKPVLVLRDTTERPEAIEAGTAKLIGTEANNIFMQTSLLLNNKSNYDSIAKAKNPFGDGNSRFKILEACLKMLNQVKV